MNCLLANRPVPLPQFIITTTEITFLDSGGFEEKSLSTIRSARDTVNMYEFQLDKILLSRLFPLNGTTTIIVNVTCQVNNRFGSDEKTTSIRACSKCKAQHNE